MYVGVEAEAELLSAIVSSLQDMGLTARDVGIKVNSRKILNGLMTKVGEPPHHSRTRTLPPTTLACIHRDG